MFITREQNNSGTAMPHEITPRGPGGLRQPKAPPVKTTGVALFGHEITSVDGKMMEMCEMQRTVVVGFGHFVFE
jgi:hypothetical protein